MNYEEQVLKLIKKIANGDEALQGDVWALELFMRLEVLRGDRERAMRMHTSLAYEKRQAAALERIAAALEASVQGGLSDAINHHY